jgi:hypothetical protein
MASVVQPPLLHSLSRYYLKGQMIGQWAVDSKLSTMSIVLISENCGENPLRQSEAETSISEKKMQYILLFCLYGTVYI